MPELRDLPAVDTLLSADELTALTAQHGVQAVRDEIRSIQSAFRKQRAVPEWGVVPSGYASAIDERLGAHAYTPVFNLTGTVLHTNLGRALLSESLWESVKPLVTRPMNLEFDLTSGRRGDRDAIIEKRLQRLTGCEAATVINNNAAALALVLNTLALDQPVPVSRGELIEIGGSFRLPELMARSGCRLVEIGTTNRTHLQDFENAAGDAAMMLKVHPSNYFIGGFSHEVSAKELAELASKHNIPSCVDLGSGTMVDLTRWGLPAEPTPQAVLADGIDLVTFSGDKLLGGTQAGIIAGRKDLLDAIKRNPLKRAMRADKITLAVLEHTLKLYENPEELPQHLPMLKTLTLTLAELEARAQQVCDALPEPWQHEIVASSSQIGSGALPDQTVPSIAVTVTAAGSSAEEIAQRLRGLSTPVICRIKDDRVWLDMRCAAMVDELCSTLRELA